MNLVEMIRLNDRNLALSGNIEVVKREFFGRTFRALRMATHSEVIVKTPFRFLPFSRCVTSVGWSAVCARGAGRLTVEYCMHESKCASYELPLGAHPADVVVPIEYATGAAMEGSALRVRSSRGECYLLVNEVMSRAELIAQCRGKGVELGPGHHPQIVPSADVSVQYVEQKAIDEWADAYSNKTDRRVDPALWARYIIGSANSIPVSDESLDFVFSSHVLEHLVNPLSSLEHWSKKLKRGGIVACVVPDAMGCKDYVFNLSNPSKWEWEYAQGVNSITEEDYFRYGRTKGMTGDYIRSMIAQSYSIHVHFYSRENIIFLLQSCLERGWFSEYRLTHKPNNKDFYFTLTK